MRMFLFFAFFSLHLLRPRAMALTSLENQDANKQKNKQVKFADRLKLIRRLAMKQEKSPSANLCLSHYFAPEWKDNGFDLFREK